MSPVDFFDPDFKLFPFARNVKFLEAELKAGDCMYVPAYFFVQSKTVAAPEVDSTGKTRPGRSIILADQYASHSAIVDLMLDGLEDENFGGSNDKAHPIDQRIYRLFGTDL